MFKKWFGKEKRSEAAPASEASSGADRDAGGAVVDEAPPPPESEADEHASPGVPEESSSATATDGDPASPPEDSTSTTTDAPPPSVEEETPKKKSRWARFAAGLAKTKKNLTTLFSLRRALDDDYLDELESELYGADFGPAVVAQLMDGEDGVRPAWKRKEIANPEDVRGYLKTQLRAQLERRDGGIARATTGPTVILVCGVNGAGKTTSIAKLAHRLRAEGHSVVLAAADTFRAAAVEQLTIWSERIGADIVTGDSGADPASVAFRGAQRAVETDADYLIVDTAGRLHTQKNLMRELGKIRSVLGKQIAEAPHEALLVLDATTGQNALNQARLFGAEVDVSGLIIAKLDGTAKGGIVVAINNELDVPVKFVGLGEKVEDFATFDCERFVEALFDSE